ncbi:MAG: dienelactone hydrolase family protein [Acidobacteriaceae bacterium]
MVEREMQIQMPDGVADAILFAPQAGKPFPGVLFLPDIGSIRAANRGMASRLAAEGYAVMLANPFYRTGRPPLWTFERSWSDPKTIQRFEELTAPLTPEACAADANSYIDRLLEQPEVRRGMVGIVGYCFTGAMALHGPASHPEHVAAAASYHGGGLFKADDPQSPHRVLPKIEARLYFGHAANDNSMTAAQIAGFEQALAEWGGIYESETYAAAHGWTVPDNPAYNELEAERAFEKLKQLFAETLG